MFSPVSMVPLKIETVGSWRRRCVGSQVLQLNTASVVHDERFPAQSVTIQSFSTISCPRNSFNDWFSVGSLGCTTDGDDIIGSFSSNDIFKFWKQSHHREEE